MNSVHVGVIFANPETSGVKAAPGSKAERVEPVQGAKMLPAAYTRLEPQSISGDPAPGQRAAIHDPLWSLFRQWQFGEFRGEDNGRILGTEVRYSTQKFGTLKVGNGAARPIDDATLIDPDFQSGAASAASPRARAEAGRALVLAIAEAIARPKAVVPDLAQLYPFAAADVLATPIALRPILRANPDARAAAAALQGSTAAWAPAGSKIAAAAATWLAWYRSSVDPPASASGWDRARLEHRFTLETANGQGFVAAEHGGGAVDWWSVDAGPKRTTAAAAPTEQVARLLAQPLRFPAMPADRYFEFEDGSVNLGGVDIEPNDPARRALVEFATLHGPDWFYVPLDVPRGGLTRIQELTVTDSFGVETIIPPATAGEAGAKFRLFAVTDGDDVLPGLLTLPSARVTLDGDPLEATLLLRDEGANMGWAIEERVEGPAGRARLRFGEARPATGMLASANDSADLVYTLETEVPLNWIPLVPVPTGGNGGFILRKGTMTDKDESRSRLLAGESVDIFDEELPAAGLRVERVPRIARSADGRVRRWTAFQVRAAAGPVASALAYDTAEPSE